MTLPALRLIEASGYNIALLGKRWAGDLMAGMGWRFDPIEGHLSEDLSRIRYLVINTGADRGLVFPNSLGSALLFRLGKLPTTGLATDCRSLLLKHAIPEPKKNIHETERFFYLAHEALKCWGTKPAFDEVPKSLGLLSLKRHEAAANNLFKQYKLPKTFALLAPIARGKHKGKAKSWTHFNDLVKPLRDAGIEPLVFPSVREEDLARQACPDARILPPTTLGNFAAIARRAKIVVANDSGVSHIAAAVGVPQITLIGVTSPERTGPWNQHALVLGTEKGWPEVDEVVAAMRRMLGAS